MNYGDSLGKLEEDFMRHVKVISKTIRDNTGINIEMPTILIEQNGEVTPCPSS